MFTFEKESNEDDSLWKVSTDANKILDISNTLPIRRKKSSFILNDLTVNYVTEADILKKLVTGVADNNNTGDEKLTQLAKKPSSVRVSILNWNLWPSIIEVTG